MAGAMPHKASPAIRGRKSVNSNFWPVVLLLMSCCTVVIDERKEIDPARYNRPPTKMPFEMIKKSPIVVEQTQSVRMPPSFGKKENFIDSKSRKEAISGLLNDSYKYPLMLLAAKKRAEGKKVFA